MLEVVPGPPSPKKSANIMLLWFLSIVGFLLIASAVALSIVAKRFEPTARRWLISSLEKRYQAGVEIGTFRASLYPVPKATVKDVVIRFHNRKDVPPLAKIREMTAESSLWGLRQHPVRISLLTVKGLEISIPPNSQGNGGNSPPTPVSPQTVPTGSTPNFILERVLANGTLLRLLPGDPAKATSDFEFEKLTLTSAGLDRPMDFHAAVGNWKPPGKIETHGHFGPWDPSDPGSTPLDGKYTFRHADLSVFKGITGILSSEGEYRGRLSRIECKGATDTPEFRVSSGRTVHLKTDFQAVVDGSNGNTILDNVTAQFMNSTIIARGGVVAMPGGKGKDIDLTIDVQKGRVEDFVHLITKSEQPFLVGALAFHAAFHLPAGSHDLMDRLTLEGHFNVPDGRFTNSWMQGLLGQFSKRAEGVPGAESGDRVKSAFSSDFTIRDGESSFNSLIFQIPGAEVSLAGTYGLRDEKINFLGKARTEARLSQMTTGFSSKILKFVDPFFARAGAGAVIPIHISGTRTHPNYGLDFKNILR
jgi:hypothetical protein